MEDFLKFLLIAGVILVGIFKEVSKNNKSKKTQNKRPVPPTPSPVEVDPDATPIPEFWGRGSKVLDDFLQSLPVEQPAPKPAPKPTPKKKKEEISVAASIANSSAQDKRNTKVLIMIIPKRTTATRKIFQSILQKKPDALLSGEKSCNASIK